MQFETDLDVGYAPGLLDRFLSIIGHDPWVKRHRSLQEQIRANPLMAPYIADAHGIEMQLGHLLQQNRRLEFSDPGDYGLFSFIAPFVSLHERLSSAGRRRVEGALRGGLNTHDGLRSLKSEVETATHLVRRGFDVTPNDIEQGGGFDFLAARGGIELEVECKTASGDLGRQVHRRRMMELSWRVSPVIQKALSSVRGGRLGRVVLPGKLLGRDVQERLATAIERTVDQAESLSTEDCAIEWRPFDLAGTPFASGDGDAVTNDAVMAFLERELGHSNRHAFVRYRPGRSAIMLVVESQKADAVLRGLMHDLKSSARAQFSKRRPGVLVVQFLELSAQDLLSLASQQSSDPRQAPAIQLATNQFFENPGRSHIHTLVYRAQSVLQVSVTTSDGRIDRSYQEQGPTYHFRNPQHPQYGDPRCSVFGIEGGARPSRSGDAGPQ